MKKLLATICAAALILTGCGENSQAISVENKEATPVKSSITIEVNGKVFSATLEDNTTAQAFADKFPLEVKATELNGNEKYFYLADDLPSAPVNVKQIHSGDLMLFGSNCVVIFYKDFATSYSYTPLGKLDNPAGIEKVLGSGNVHIKFERS